MSAASRIAAECERRAARALGGRRHIRASRSEVAPDIDGVAGWQPEVKFRKKLPLLVTKALAQAESYSNLDQKPVAILYERGSSRGIACLRIEHFAALIRAANPDASPSPDHVTSDAIRY